ncbi:MAG: hypothetical protein RLZZ621_1583 [Gemmatimonadota bacterium]
MPNGGTHHCAYCRHFDTDRQHCTLRNIPINGSYWTSCQNSDEGVTEPTGPLYAIVCEVREQGRAYATIPFWGDARPEMVQEFPSPDTHVLVRFTDGRRLRFESILENLDALQQAGMMPEGR